MIQGGRACLCVGVYLAAVGSCVGGRRMKLIMVDHGDSGSEEEEEEEERRESVYAGLTRVKSRGQSVVSGEVAVVVVGLGAKIGDRGRDAR